MKHHIERTSPKGKGMPFIGRCILCGKEGLHPRDAAPDAEECPNPRGISSVDAFCMAIEGNSDANILQIDVSEDGILTIEGLEK